MKEELPLLLLGMDTAAKTCSVSLLEEKEVLAEYTQNLPQTHSEKLFPLVDSIIRDTGRNAEEIDAVAVSRGPGSFTGLRIGVSTARALAQGLQIPVVGVNTLEVLAKGVCFYGGLICPIMDARRQQVYAAIYRYDLVDENLQVLMEPAAVHLEFITETLKKYREPVIFPGDGTRSYEKELKEALGESYLPLPSPFTYQRASLVAWCGRWKLFFEDEVTSYLELKPLYLRASEAERKYGGKAFSE